MYDPNSNFFGLVASAMAALERCAACPADVAAFLAALVTAPIPTQQELSTVYI